MAGGRRKQRYAASNLDPSWNVQDEVPGEGSQFFSPAEASVERPNQAIDAQSPTISRQVTPHSDAFSLPRATPAQDQQPTTQQSQTQSQSPSHLEVLELPVTRGSTPSRHSRDGEESASTVSSSAPSRSAKGKKKRYVTEHSADWVEDDLVYSAGPSLGPYPQQTLAAMPHQPQQQMQPSSSIVAQPPDLTTPSSMATTSPALSIFRGGGHQTNSPGQDAPAIQPGAPSASSPASPFAGVGQPSAHQAQQAPDNHLGVIVEEQQQQTGPLEPPPPPQPHPQVLPAQAKKKGWSRLLRRG